MIKKILVPILFTVIIFISLAFLNNINSQKADIQLLKDVTPTKFTNNIHDYEKGLGFTTIILDNLQKNIYRQYELNETTFGFIAGTMGYEEEMLIYVQLEYTENNLIKVNQVEILYENETDGYGDYVVEPWFLDRFKQEISTNLNMVRRKKTEENQVIAITGATITSEAVIHAVNDCKKIMEDSKNENE